MKRLVIFLTFLVMVLVASLLAALNAVPVLFDYYLGSLELPLSWLLFLAFAVGTLFATTVCSLMMFRQIRMRSQLRKQLRLCQQEIRNLRDIPIKDHL